MSRQKAGESAGLEIPYGVKRAFNSHALEFLRFFRDVNRDIFVASFLVYLALIVLDTVWDGFASHFFNLNVILVVVVVTGMLAMITAGASQAGTARRLEEIPRKIAIPAAVVFGIAGGSFIFVATPLSGQGAWWAAAGGGVAIALLAWLFYEWKSDMGERGSGYDGNAAERPEERRL
jgi:O-antigen/teichoic acid export membrane protein